LAAVVKSRVNKRFLIVLKFVPFPGVVLVLVPFPGVVATGGVGVTGVLAIAFSANALIYVSSSLMQEVIRAIKAAPLNPIDFKNSYRVIGVNYCFLGYLLYYAPSY
jgi:hypothetical protein